MGCHCDTVKVDKNADDGERWVAGGREYTQGGVWGSHFGERSLCVGVGVEVSRTG